LRLISISLHSLNKYIYIFSKLFLILFFFLNSNSISHIIYDR
jgi:hypothetical protein